VAFHLALLLIFLFLGLPSGAEPDGAKIGLTIQFGLDKEGLGDNETPVNPEHSETETPEITDTEVQPSPSNPVDEQVITQNQVQTIDVNSSEEKQDPVEDPKEKEVDQKLKQIEQAWGNSSDNPQDPVGNGNNEGNDSKGSLNGEPNGDDDTKGQEGKDDKLTNLPRKIRFRPKIENDTKFEGIVYVDIIFDRSGNVIRATPGAKGTRTSNAVLWKKAKDYAMKLKLYPNPNAPAEQRGRIPVEFIAK